MFSCALQRKQTVYRNENITAFEYIILRDVQGYEKMAKLYKLHDKLDDLALYLMTRSCRHTSGLYEYKKPGGHSDSKHTGVWKPQSVGAIFTSEKLLI